jgi:cytoskeleton protein RodZ
MKELAAYLKSERMNQGITLQQMSEKVRVSISMLQALEEGNYDRIGTALLIRSFIRNYCASLGMNSQPLIEKYAEGINAYDQQDEGIRRFGRWSKALRKKSRIGIYAILLLGIVVMVTVYGGVSLWKSTKESSTTQSLRTSGYPQQELPSDLSPKTPGQSSESEAQKGVSAGAGKDGRPAIEGSGSKTEKAPAAAMARPQEAPALKPPAMGTTPAEVLPESAEKPAAALPVGEKHHFLVEANQKTWIQVTMDEKTTQNAMLEPGEKRHWEAEKNMKIVVGNAGGIQMKWDGRPVEIPAKSGSVIRFGLPDQRYVKE